MLKNQDRQIQEASQKLANQGSFNVNNDNRGAQLSPVEGQRVDEQLNISPTGINNEQDATFSVENMNLLSPPIQLESPDIILKDDDNDSLKIT